MLHKPFQVSIKFKESYILSCICYESHEQVETGLGIIKYKVYFSAWVWDIKPHTKEWTLIHDPSLKVLWQSKVMDKATLRLTPLPTLLYRHGQIRGTGVPMKVDTTGLSLPCPLKEIQRKPAEHKAL